MSSGEIFIVVLVTAIIMVVAALIIGKLLAPKSTNAQKGEPYECGIPTRGTSWMQFKVGYYLFAILFLMFDVETVLLFPWATIMKSLGTMGLVSVAFFLLVLVLGLAYAWKKGALEWK
ncbi:MAG: NADH-quinone oxidoreductase subunit A [Paludibacteraceae bacterium]|jgi:NADH-quinone oxidoreductase subunit A|nr:NADH-quinone oxidoreductase subunit A [Paludibacteraceae bacterium]MBO7606593.1 NADH-quinone oxidoreductase subunit A [Paludibacteraceae bacterium]MBP5481496.1 NADH-quinone oxidoreductase subunit A [Paludibacteraceae bacterium]MBR3519287.1 NADH-quinone oxidoreductase subunit A [Paludibacteraceae bacterium]MBR4713206.1 NADH-quinone oxidoreductase subunit A [Paludibacteraceae bacterium]